ncbi:MAG: DUF2064 domain-containing protein [Ilumatobacteraceae bacterium]
MHLTVIAKAPVAGQVKTRLCPPCSLDQAAEIATAALADTLDAILAVVAGTSIRPVLLIDGEPPAFTPAEFEVVPQRGDGLEQRLQHGFCDLGPGLIAGMDTPFAVAGSCAAFGQLARGVDVLGLAIDGGYWSIGLSRFDADFLDAVFRDVPMSTSRTGVHQLRRLHQLGRPVHMLASTRDLDTVDDLVAATAVQRPGRLGGVLSAVASTLG